MLDLQWGNRKKRVTRRGDLNHAQSITCRGQGLFRFVGRISGRHKNHLIQVKDLTGGLSQDQMSLVDRIKSSAENTL